ncbi:MAG: Gfo/Idh/MocA family oxidoreductase [Bacteroidota bacterium]|nr:Gfo/Idh/MocA family oxidoreductase [Bacteroidota bacterium]
MKFGSVRIGIIGCGSMAREHAAALSVTSGVRIAACADIDPEKARCFAAEYGVNRYTDDAGQVIRDPGIDAVYICTRHDSHAALAVAAAKARKHMFIEKPLAMSTAEARSIGHAVRTARVRCMIGFKLRFHRTVSLLRVAVPRPVLSIAQVCDEIWPDGFWANDPREGGGNILSQGGHAVDLLCAFHAAPPIRVHAEGGTLTHQGAAVPDTACAVVLFSDGSVASLAIADAGTSPVVSKFSFQVMDGKRCAHLTDRCLSLAVSEPGRVEIAREETDRSVLRENAHFLHCLRTGDPFRTGFRAGMRAVVLIEAILESIATGLPRRVDPSEWLIEGIRD